MQDRRQDIIDSAIAILREMGYSGLTQPRVAKALDMRQSHITYYFPTRLDLLKAVARVAIDRQLSGFDMLIASAPQGQIGARIAALISRKENTRVLLALVQGADQEPELRILFRELAAGMVDRGRALFPGATDDTGAYFMHALSVGLAIVDLATDPEAGEARATTLLDQAMAHFQTGDEK